MLPVIQWIPSFQFLKKEMGDGKEDRGGKRDPRAYDQDPDTNL